MNQEITWGGGDKLAKLFLSVCLLLLFSPKYLCAQEIIPGILYLNTLSEEAHPGENRIVQDETLFSVFQQFGVSSYKQTLPFARTPYLWGVYTIECTGDVEALKTALEEQASELVTDLMFVYEPEYNYQPEDDFWVDGSLWHLNKIQADSAWDITRSSDSIDVTILDFPPDIFHPDLASKINPPYNPLTGYEYHHMYADTWPAHGTAVAGFVAGETTETGGSPEGKLASIGFNSNMMLYHFDGTSQVVQGVHASTVMGAEVITISNNFSGFNTTQPDETRKAMIQEILDNGTVVVLSAGNNPEYTQDNPYFDEIIIVSSTDSTDHFAHTKPNGDIQHHAHYPAVDLCAPGWSMMGATNTWLDNIYVIDTISGDTTEIIDSIPNPNLYTPAWSGTSFAAPITAGVAALIKSINPCLSPEDVQYILKNTTDPIADDNLYSGIGTGRLNAYKAVKMAHDSYRFQSYTVHNGEDLTWNDVHFIDTLYIEPGGKLTINADCFFNAGGKAIIDTLAKLTVNNATLTTTCRNMWYGIEVWGNKNASQFPDMNYNYVQGRLVLNGASLKNAHEAISLWKDNDFNSTGGYVIAENSNFINNRRAVAFMSYHNFHPVTLDPEPNLSKIKNCEFILNESYLNDSPFHGFVSLWDVEGLQFEACSFANNRDSIYNSSGNLINDSLSGFGIWAVDAGFTVTSSANGQQVDSSRFEKLEYGIHAMSANATSRAATANIFIEESHFEQNITGIYTSAVYLPLIIHNTFNINPIDTAGNAIYGGVYLDKYTTGFIVEENVFKDGQGITGGGIGATAQSVGVCVNNSGGKDHYIYNNKFEDLYVGILAQNHNRSVDYGKTGLEIKCNELYNNQFDIAVTADLPYSITDGIKASQGSDGFDIKDPAGNIFSPSHVQIDDAWDIYTEVNNNKITYWYHEDQGGYDLKPDSVTFLLVEVTANENFTGTYTRTGACEPNYSGGGGGIGIEGLKNLVNSMDVKTDSVSSLLALLVDGGDTEGTANEVETAWPDETMDIRDDLLEKSPYLSDTVMVTTVKQEDVLPAAIVTEILTANPQSAKSDKVLDEVYAREDVTNNQIDQIEANNMVTGAKESLETKLAHYSGQRTYALNRLIAAYKTDTSIVKTTDSVIAILHTQNFAAAKYRLAFEYLANGDWQQAQDSLETIPDNYDLDATALNEQLQLEDYFDVMIQLAQNGNTIFEMTASQKSDLYAIYQNSNGRAGALAQNILQTADTLTYKENYILPTEGAKTGEVRRRRANKNFESHKLKVYPNPARDYVIVEYQVAGDADKVVVKLIDNNGFIRQTIVQENNMGFTVIDTRGLETGSYIAHIAASGKLVGVAKFIVVP